MPISGLVITLSDTPALAETALATLRRDRRIEFGKRLGQCQPVVVDTADNDEDGRLWKQLNEQQGILKVDVVFVCFDETPHWRYEHASGRSPDIHETGGHGGGHGCR